MDLDAAAGDLTVHSLLDMFKDDAHEANLDLTDSRLWSNFASTISPFFYVEDIWFSIPLDNTGIISM